MRVLWRHLIEADGVVLSGTTMV